MYCFIAMIQLHKYTDAGGNPWNTDDSRCSSTKRLFTSWLLDFRHEERETQFLLCRLFLHRPKPTPSWTDRPRVKISTHFWTARPRVKISTNWPNKRAAHPVPHFWTAWPRVKISTNWFFQKSPKFPAHRFRTWCHSHPSLTSYLVFFIMPFVIVISSVRERELYSMCEPAPALSRIVQNPTKPNDKI